MDPHPGHPTCRGAAAGAPACAQPVGTAAQAGPTAGDAAL